MQSERIYQCRVFLIHVRFILATSQPDCFDSSLYSLLPYEKIWNPDANPINLSWEFRLYSTWGDKLMYEYWLRCGDKRGGSDATGVTTRQTNECESYITLVNADLSFVTKKKRIVRNGSVSIANRSGSIPCCVFHYTLLFFQLFLNSFLQLEINYTFLWLCSRLASLLVGY